MASGNYENRIQGLAENYVKKDKPVPEKPEKSKKTENPVQKKDVEPDPTPKVVEVVREKKLGRPSKGPKKCYSVYIPEELVENLELASQMFRYKTPTEYMAHIVLEELKTQKAKIDKFKSSIEDILD